MLRMRHTPAGIQLPRVDGRTIAARRFRDLCAAFEAEVGGVLSESDKAMVAQAAALSLRAEELQADLIRGRDIDNDLLVKLSGTVKRILSVIGAKAKDKPAGDALAEHLATHYPETVEADD